MTCAPSKDQPGNLPSLNRVFAVRLKKAQVLSYPLSAQRRLIKLSGCAGWSGFSLTHMSFLSCSGSISLFKSMFCIWPFQKNPKDTIRYGLTKPRGHKTLIDKCSRTSDIRYGLTNPKGSSDTNKDPSDMN